ncbi:MAG: hypothetical protein R3Y33_08295 [Clostridia bacterium]
MDDISGQLNKILSDPSSMAQIQNIMSGLGLGGNDTQNTVETPEPVQTTDNPLGDIDMVSMMGKIAPLLGTIKQDDNSTRLLSALKPMLSNSRQEKITQAIRILQLLKLMPMLKDSGMLSSLLGGLF